MVRIHARQLVQAETLTLHQHSSLLRETLCETLVLLSVHGNELFRERLGLDVEGQVNEVIRDLLTPSIRQIGSLNSMTFPDMQKQRRTCFWMC